jgi:hypothetical protein
MFMATSGPSNVPGRAEVSHLAGQSEWAGLNGSGSLVLNKGLT